MSKTIHKYPLAIGAIGHTICMHEGFHVLHLSEEYSCPVIWVLSDPSRPLRNVVIDCYCLGMCLPDDPGIPLGTYTQVPTGSAWHFFERLE